MRVGGRSRRRPGRAPGMQWANSRLRLVVNPACLGDDLRSTRTQLHTGELATPRWGERGQVVELLPPPPTPPGCSLPGSCSLLEARLQKHKRKTRTPLVLGLGAVRPPPPPPCKQQGDRQAARRPASHQHGTHCRVPTPIPRPRGGPGRGPGRPGGGGGARGGGAGAFAPGLSDTITGLFDELDFTFLRPLFAALDMNLTL